MDIEQISTNLALLPQLNKKQVYELLFNIGLSDKQFKRLLAITHTTQIQKKLLEVKSNIRLKEGQGSLATRLNVLLEGNTINLNTYEYHIVYTLVDSPYITKAIRESLKSTLDYIPLTFGTREERKVAPCVICGYPTSNGFCLSCIRKIHEYAEYRRESFVVPINYINFNIRNYINTTGSYQIYYNDWIITKEHSSVNFKLIQELQEGIDPIQYPLPFIDYQKTILS